MGRFTWGTPLPQMIAAMPETELSPHAPPLEPLSGRTAAAMLVFGVTWPTVCFLITADGSLINAALQLSDLRTYALYLLSGRTCFVFYPFLLYAVVCLVALLTDETRKAPRFAVRFGVYSGVVLAYHFASVMSMVVFGARYEANWLSISLIVGVVVPAATAVVVVAVLVCRLIATAGKKAASPPANADAGWMGGSAASRWTVVAVVLLLMVGGFLAAEMHGGAGLLMILPVVVAVASIALMCVGGPFHTLVVFAVMSRRAFRLSGGRLQFRLLHLLAAFTWLSAYLAAWRFAVERTLALHHGLPT